MTIVGSIGDRLTESGSGISLDASQIGQLLARRGRRRPRRCCLPRHRSVRRRLRLATGVRHRRRLGLGILLVRRSVPESPRWLFIHGRNEEAEEIVGEIESGVEEETGEKLSEPKESLEVPCPVLI